MKPESLRELVEESLGQIKVVVKNNRFTISASTKWFEFFSGLFNETTLVPEVKKERKPRQKKGLPKVNFDPFADAQSKEKEA